MGWQDWGADVLIERWGRHAVVPTRAAALGDLTKAMCQHELPTSRPQVRGKRRILITYSGPSGRHAVFCQQSEEKAGDECCLQHVFGAWDVVPAPELAASCVHFGSLITSKSTTARLQRMGQLAVLAARRRNLE